MTRAFVWAVLLTVSSVCSHGQNKAQQDNARPPYRIFEAVEPDEIKNILNRYGADGYRLIAVAQADKQGVLGIMHLSPTSTYTFDYRVFRSSWLTLDKRLRQNKPSILEQVNAAGSEGYRLLPNAMGYDNWDCALIMEKRSLEPSLFEYRAFAPELLKKPRFEDIIANFEQARKDGFSTVFFGGDNHFPYVLISERTSTQQSPVGPEIVNDHFFVTQLKELFHVVQQEADAGFAARFSTVSKSSPGLIGDGPLRMNLWTHRVADKPLKMISVGQKNPHDFDSFRSVLAQFQDRLNSDGEGLCVIGIPVIASDSPTFFRSSKTFQMEIAMGPCPAGVKATYRYALGETTAIYIEDVNKLAAEGYALVPSTFDSNSVLMEKLTE